MPRHDAPERWWTRVARRPATLLAVGVLVLGLHLGITLHRRTRHAGDFDVSREFGRRFLAGEHLYAGGLHYPYLPVAGAWFAPLALAPSEIAFVARYLVSVGALVVTMGLLARCTRTRLPLPARRDVPVAALTLFLGAHYVLRDLDDGGPHLQLLALVVIGVDAVCRQRTALAAVAVGLAATLKAPLGLFLPFFAWDRRWPLAAATAAAAVVWLALPALWMGPSGWWTHQRHWLTYAGASVAGSPLPGAAASEGRIQNQALRPVLQRLLAPAVPPAEPAVVDAGLPPPVARGLALALCAGLVAACVWRARRIERDRRWLPGCAAVALLSVLLAPLAWVQHLVLALPALYLIVAQGLSRGLPRPAVAALLAYALLALALNRELLGRDTYVVLLGLGLHTVCMLLLLGIVVLACPATGAPSVRPRRPPF